jgi:hypothetical protein
VTSIAADYQLIWPRQLFQTETAALVNNTRINDWAGRCELLLEDAFLGIAPRDDFRAIPGQEHDFLIKLLRRAETLRKRASDGLPTGLNASAVRHQAPFRWPGQFVISSGLPTTLTLMATSRRSSTRTA